MSKKVLAIIRVSTTVQETQSQRNDITEFLKAKGFNENEIEYIEAKGASARKANAQYIRFIESIKEKTGGTDGIKIVAMWHLNRLGRIKKYLTDMENWFVTNGVQMYVKNGFDMPLLDESGKETLGASIAFSVYSAIVEADTEELMEKLKRGKAENARNNRFNGGKIHFGYGVNSNGNYFVDNDEAELIRQMYNLYNSGEYSTPKLVKELQERGYKMRGKTISLHFVNNMLKSTAFIGYTEWNGVRRSYPRIISDDLYNSVQNRLAANHKGEIGQQHKHTHLATKLIICPECGRHFFASNRSYCCIGHKYHGQEIDGQETCPNGDSISVDWVDVAVWHVAKTIEYQHIVNFTDSKEEEAKKQIEVNQLKIDTLKNNIANIGNKQKRIYEAYIEGGIDKTTRDKKLAAVKSDVAEMEKQITELENDNTELERLVSYADNTVIINMGRLSIRGINEDAEENYKITHRHIKSVVITPYEYNGKIQKLITIETKIGQVVKFLYIAKSKVKDKDNGRIYKIFRFEENGELEPIIATPDYVPCWVEG